MKIDRFYLITYSIIFFLFYFFVEKIEMRKTVKSRKLLEFLKVCHLILCTFYILSAKKQISEDSKKIVRLLISRECWLSSQFSVCVLKKKKGEEERKIFESKKNIHETRKSNFPSSQLPQRCHSPST